MQARKTITTLTALAIGLSSTLAFAGRDDDDRGRRDDRHGRYEQRDRDDHSDRRAYRHGYRDGRQEQRRPVVVVRGAGPDHRWHRGDRLPYEYRSRQVVVRDWRPYHLSAPPRGHQWVQVGADFALIAIATGIIAQVVLR